MIDRLSYTPKACQLFLLLILFIGAGDASAQSAPNTSSGTNGIPMDERASATGGFGAWMISSLFESGSLSDMPADTGIIGAVIQPFSLVCAMVVVLIITFKGVQHLLIAAQAKDLEQSPMSMTWAPLHMVFAVALAIPMPQSGYSMGQYVAIWLAEQSNLLGNLTSENVVDTSQYGLITEVPLPGVRTAVQGMVDSHVCKVLFNSLGRYMASQQGAQMEVTPVQVSDGPTLAELAAPNPGGFGGNGEIQRSAVAYSVKRNGAAGDFVNGDRDALDFCGSVVVEYDAYFDGQQTWDRPQQASPDGSGGECAGGILCGTTDLTRSSDKQKVMNAFSTAHSNIRDSFISRATDASGGIGTAVDALTWDIDEYFESLGDPEKMESYRNAQFNEPAQIERAAAAVASEIDSMQTDVTGYYESAIDNLRSQNSSTGDSHKDAVFRTGWTVLGLYWFQQNNYNSAVMDSVNFNAAAQISPGRIIRMLQQATGDEKFATRMADRLTKYRRAVNRKIMNSRLDPNPLQYAADGSLASSANDPMEQRVQGAKMREELPVYLESLIQSNAESQGSIIGDSDVVGPDVINNWFRGSVFPYIVGNLVDDNLVTSLVNTGHTLVTIAGTFYAIELVARSTMEWATEAQKKNLLSEAAKAVLNPVDWVAAKGVSAYILTWPGFLVKNLLSDLKPMFMYLFLLGLFLAFYLPAVIMVQWIIGLVQWLIYVVEAVIVIPLWSILFASDMGQKAFAPQTAQQGLIHLLSILFYPTLLVIGFTIGMKVLDLIGVFLVDYIMIGFMGMTTGYTFGPVSVIAGLTLVAIVAYQVIMRVFSGMLELNERAINWIGQRQTFGENNVEQAARAGMVGIIQRGESMGQKNAGNRQGQGQGQKAPGVQRPGSNNQGGGAF